MARKETIFIRPKPLVDRFNDPLPDLDQPEWREVPGAVVVPRSSGDFEQRGQIILSGFMVKLPATDPVEDTDSLKIRGLVHEVDGSVGNYGKVKIFYTNRAN